MATKRKGNDCYEKAKPDEPVFTLRAQDRLAPELVRQWAVQAHLNGCPEKKVNEALKCAGEMEDWAQKNGSKFPD